MQVAVVVDKHHHLLAEKVAVVMVKVMVMQVQGNQVQQTLVVEAVEHFHSQETMVVVQAVQV
jgi:hypothetical protein